MVSLALFDCHNHPNGKMSLHIAPDILCDSAERTGMLFAGIVATALYCGGGLACAVWALYVAPRRFREHAFRKRWRFLLSRLPLVRPAGRRSRVVQRRS